MPLPCSDLARFACLTCHAFLRAGTARYSICGAIWSGVSIPKGAAGSATVAPELALQPIAVMLFPNVAACTFADLSTRTQTTKKASSLEVVC